MLGKSEIKSAGAASPRTDSGTLENPRPPLPAWIPELWLTALQADVLHLYG
jgi:hypothetical protein